MIKYSLKSVSPLLLHIIIKSFIVHSMNMLWRFRYHTTTSRDV